MKTQLRTFHLTAALLALTVPQAWASPDEDDDTSGSAYIVFDNTANRGVPAIITNMRTDYESGCDKSDALERKACNSFGVRQSNIQILRRGDDDSLVVDVGVHNENATSYENYDDPGERLTFFEEGQHLFDLDAFRNAAKWIDDNRSGFVPAGTTGTISWEQFIKNVAEGKTMYGFVRVKVPLAVKGAGTNAFGRKKSRVYGLCQKKDTVRCGCGPGAGEEPNIKPGATVCGIKIGPQAKLDVRGSLMFDFVDCDTKQPIPLENLPESPREIYFKVEVPILVNPADPRPQDGVMSNIDQIAAISTTKSCGAAPCSTEVTTTIPYSLVANSARDDYQYRNAEPLTDQIFSVLPAAEQYQLLMPSGYVSGWLEAFDRLNITMADWTRPRAQNGLGFRASQSSGAFTAEAIRSSEFEDIPVYMYTGGLVDMHYHVNISGLVYVPQAMELEQKGQKIKQTVSESTIISGKTRSEHECEDDDNLLKDVSKDSYKGKIRARSGSDDGKCLETKELFIPSKQYIRGAIIVRDGFFLEAEKAGGISLISNDPEAYSQIRVNQEGVTGTFQAYTSKAYAPPGGENGDDSPNDGGGGGGGANPANPGPQWVEIRAR